MSSGYPTRTAVGLHSPRGGTMKSSSTTTSTSSYSASSTGGVVNGGRLVVAQPAPPTITTPIVNSSSTNTMSSSSNFGNVAGNLATGTHAVNQFATDPLAPPDWIQKVGRVAEVVL